METGLFHLHRWYGELLQAVPIILLIWYAIRKQTPLQRIAPILLDVNVLIGFLLYILAGRSVSIWHPILMIVAVVLGHSVAKTDNRVSIIGAWVGALACIVLAILIAKGTIAIGPMLPAIG